MAYFTLRTFEPLTPSRISGLALLGETQFVTRTAEEAKGKLSAWIESGLLDRERFYRFEGFAPFRGGRPQFVLNISFYLFEDGRLCPLRIWHRDEQASNQTGESDWLVDFNGIPGWSLIASIEPRWRVFQAPASEDRWTGRSHRDWYKRSCWTVVSQPASDAKVHHPFKVAC